jgi:hypothetical protein
MPLSRTTRFLTLLFAAIQFATPAVISVADGAVARGGRNSASHVEDVGGKQCRPPHTEDCLLCRFLSATHSTAAAAPRPVIEQSVASISTMFDARSSVADRYGFNSRAPPTLPI